MNNLHNQSALDTTTLRESVVQEWKQTDADVNESKLCGQKPNTKLEKLKRLSSYFDGESKKWIVVNPNYILVGYIVDINPHMKTMANEFEGAEETTKVELDDFWVEVDVEVRSNPNEFRIYCVLVQLRQICSCLDDAVSALVHIM